MWNIQPVLSNKTYANAENGCGERPERIATREYVCLMASLDAANATRKAPISSNENPRLVRGVLFSERSSL